MKHKNFGPEAICDYEEKSDVRKLTKQEVEQIDRQLKEDLKRLGLSTKQVGQRGEV